MNAAVRDGRLSASMRDAEIARREAKRARRRTGKGAPRKTAKPKRRKSKTSKTSTPKRRKSKTSTPKRRKSKTSAPKRRKSKTSVPARRKPKAPKVRRESDWGRRIRRGVERGLTPTQAAGRPTADELSASVQTAWASNDLDLLIDDDGRLTPLLAAEIRRLTRADDSQIGMAPLRSLLVDLLSRAGGVTDHSHRGPANRLCTQCGRADQEHVANAIGAIYEKLFSDPHKGFNLFFGGLYPEVTWNY